MKYIDDALIKGDLFSGICIMDYEEATYRFNLDGIDVQIIETIVKDTNERKVINFEFKTSSPVRFRFDLYIPDNIINAHIGLNGKELVGFFDKDAVVSNPEPLIKGSCNDPHKVSTLHKGEFQALNFKWENNDIITLAYYFHK